MRPLIFLVRAIARFSSPIAHTLPRAIPPRLVSSPSHFFRRTLGNLFLKPFVSGNSSSEGACPNCAFLFTCNLRNHKLVSSDARKAAEIQGYNTPRTASAPLAPRLLHLESSCSILSPWFASHSSLGRWESRFMEWVRRLLHVPATETQTGIVLGLCIFAMSVMSIVLVWQAQIIANQKAVIRMFESRFGG